MSEQNTHFGYQTVSTAEKTERVKNVFHSVARNYDLMNDLMSLGLHRIWKRFVISRMNLSHEHRILDLACGTGDLSLLMQEHLNRKFNHSLDIIQNTDTQNGIYLCDINASMLSIAKKKFIDKGVLKNIHFIQADAEHLPFPTHYFDGISMGFGLRNVTRQAQALTEMSRVLKPGGRLVILEFSRPVHSSFNALYDAYSFNILPMLGKLIAKDADSYRYLAESIRKHPSQEILKQMMQDAGLDQVSYQNISGGIVALHLGFRNQ